MVNHQNALLKNAEAARKRAATKAQHHDAAMAGTPQSPAAPMLPAQQPQLGNGTSAMVTHPASMSILVLEHGKHGTERDLTPMVLLGKSSLVLTSPVYYASQCEFASSRWTLVIGRQCYFIGSLSSLILLTDANEESIHHTTEAQPAIGNLTDASSACLMEPGVNTSEERSLSSGNASPETLAGTLTPDIMSTPMKLPDLRNKPQLVQANGLTPTPLRPAKNLTHRSHALEPEGTSPLGKENIPLTPPDLASVASVLGKRSTTLPSDEIIEVIADESDELPDTEDKPRKKKQKWSLRTLQLTGAREKVLLGSYSHFRFLLVTTDPWVVDEAADSLAITAWFMRLDYLIANAHYKGRPSPTLEELNVIKQRRSQHRGDIKKAARLFVGHPGNATFKFITPKDAAGIKQNRDLVEALTKRGAYTFADFASRQGLFETPLLPQIIGKVYFDDGIKSEGLAFFGTDGEIPFTVVALVFAAILCAIDEWKTGRHDTKNIAFTKPLYEDSYKTHLKNLQNWAKHCSEKMKEPQIPIDFRKKLYAQGKLFAGITDDEPDADSQNIEEDIFTAADFAANYYATS
ncbi:hypothetical protein EV421DRAFT_1981064 [Armillaria borealis]|uniref:DUF6532 domain-containing protein n=3 Tax=Armillaria borealis TaxID=47425 RepID=A0AA39M5I0_9AGAR|nr:hypothetical protein EV421DRAFT_1981064 [Armillaria borealis]